MLLWMSQSPSHRGLPSFLRRSMKYRVIVYVSIPFSSGPTFFREYVCGYHGRDSVCLNPLLIGAYLLSLRSGLDHCKDCVSIPFSSGPTFFRNPRKKWEMRDHRSLNPLLIGAYLLSIMTIEVPTADLMSQSPSHRGLPSFTQGVTNDVYPERLNPLLIGAYLLSERRTIKMHVERIKSQSPSHRGLPSFGEKK